MEISTMTDTFPQCGVNFEEKYVQKLMFLYFHIFSI